MTMSVLRSAFLSGKYKKVQNTWETKTKVKRYWEKAENLMIKQKYKLA